VRRGSSPGGVHGETGDQLDDLGQGAFGGVDLDRAIDAGQRRDSTSGVDPVPVQQQLPGGVDV
jgi:hypothetical protein